MLKFVHVLLITTHIYTCNGEWFSSVVHMQTLVRDKLHTITELEQYISEREDQLDEMENAIDDMKIGRTNSAEFIGHPVNQFALLRTMKPQYQRIYELMHDNSSKNLYNGIGKKIKSLPGIEDVKGAAKAIMRIQQVYDLSVYDVADGMIRDSVGVGRLSADDCFTIGMIAHSEMDLYNAELWLTEAHEKSKLGDKSRNRYEIVNILGSTLAKLGKLLQSSKCLEEAIELSPTDADRKFFLQTREKLQKRIAKANATSLSDMVSRKPVLQDKTSSFSWFPIYQSLCRSEGFPTPPKVEKKLKCYLWHNEKNWLKLAPYKIEELWNSPHIVRFYDILSGIEIDKLINHTSPMLQRAIVVRQDKNITSLGRISKTAYVEDPMGGLTSRISDRITHLTGLKTRNSSEILQVSNYGIGGQFEPHYDNRRKHANISGPYVSDRIATMMFYLSDVEQGGSTIFMHPKIAVKPIKGSGILWFNLLSSGEVDRRTDHAGCPVLIGSKWISNKWIHERNQVFN